MRKAGINKRAEYLDLLSSLILTVPLVHLFMLLEPTVLKSGDRLGLALVSFGLLSTALLNGFQIMALYYMVKEGWDILEFYKDEGALFIIVFIFCIILMSLGSIAFGLRHGSFF